MYITLTSVVVTKNPFKRVKFWYWAVSCMMQAESMLQYHDITTFNGERLVMTVWNDQKGIREFIASEVSQRVMRKKVLNDVCTSSRFYSYQTDRIPSWEEAFHLLSIKGELYS
jgi:hypothetical protein